MEANIGDEQHAALDSCLKGNGHANSRNTTTRGKLCKSHTLSHTLLPEGPRIQNQHMANGHGAITRWTPCVPRAPVDRTWTRIWGTCPQNQATANAASTALPAQLIPNEWQNDTAIFDSLYSSKKGMCSWLDPTSQTAECALPARRWRPSGPRAAWLQGFSALPMVAMLGCSHKRQAVCPASRVESESKSPRQVETPKDSTGK